ncbi:MAG TPA: hypothetical protein VMX55_13280, partial [candidate division Zixibacteria bacterium]|nr:hypothetical protein [candidate division Zixibacteria bacterium]
KSALTLELLSSQTSLNVLANTSPIFLLMLLPQTTQSKITLKLNQLVLLIQPFYSFDWGLVHKRSKKSRKN